MPQEVLSKENRTGKESVPSKETFVILSDVDGGHTPTTISVSLQPSSGGRGAVSRKCPSQYEFLGTLSTHKIQTHKNDSLR